METLSLALMEKVVQDSLDYSLMLCPVGSYSALGITAQSPLQVCDTWRDDAHGFHWV